MHLPIIACELARAPGHVGGAPAPGATGRDASREGCGRMEWVAAGETRSRAVVAAAVMHYSRTPYVLVRENSVERKFVIVIVVATRWRAWHGIM